ncbi:MAG: DUF5107 domain-containing protein [Ignavibacteria bacterium]|nr:DUF5107 domain-containing protein [Ignavibacteria bacterium]
MINRIEEIDLEKVIIESDSVKCVFLPALGGKMISFYNKETGTEFLLSPQNDSRKYETAYYGADFSRYDASGFDECFPTITAVDELLSQEGKDKIIRFPDHGELWSRAWSYEIKDGSLVMSITGVNAEYLFTKKIGVVKNKLRIDYSVKNLSQHNIPYLWSAHPLINIQKGDRIILPVSVDKLKLEWSSDERNSKIEDYHHWPYLLGEENIDFSEIPGIKYNHAMKLFTYQLSDGHAAFHKTQENESLIYSFDAKKIPYLGLWLCYGGWPVNNGRKHLTIAIEPSTAKTDSLKEAIHHTEAVILQPDQCNSWSLEMKLIKGVPDSFI